MWTQYKKTFARMQLMIAMITGFIFFGFHRAWQPSLLFFLTMQVGAALGAMWATRLRRLLAGRTT